MQKHQVMKENIVFEAQGEAHWQFCSWAWGMTREQSLRNEKSAIVQFVKAQNNNV